MIPLLPQPHQQSRLNESSRNASCNSTINTVREKNGREGGREGIRKANELGMRGSEN